MVEIHPIKAFADNYIWAIKHNNLAAVVDPGDHAPVLAWLAHNNCRLTDIIVTHHHHDHTGGIMSLKEHYQPQVHGPANIKGVTNIINDGDSIALDNFATTLHAIATPGHTLDHICYYNDSWLFCADTLFSGGCGRLFEGDPAMMLDSLTKLAALGPQLQVYCAHEYTVANCKFAVNVDPDNTKLVKHLVQAQQLRQQDQPTLPSTLADELQINPYLTCMTAKHRQQMNISEQAKISALAAFTEIRAKKDNWAAK